MKGSLKGISKAGLMAIVVVVIALAVGGAYFLMAPPAPAPTSSPSPTPTPTPTITPTGEEGPIPRPTIAPQFQPRDVTLSEAKSHARFAFKVPAWTAGYGLKRVAIVAEGRGVYLLFSDQELADYDTGTLIDYNNDACYDDVELVEGAPEVVLIISLQEQKISAETLQHYRDKGWQVTTLANGEPAYGKNELIRWWDGNVLYEIHGYKLTWSQLLRIAGSAR